MEDDVNRPGRRRWFLWGGGLLLALFGAYLAVAVSRSREPARQRFAPGYAGSAACAECHPALARAQDPTHHAQALHDASQVEARTPLPEPKWVPDPQVSVAYRITRHGEQLGVEGQAGPNQEWQPVQWAFGSGHQGITFVGKTSDNLYVESALTYYRHTGWDFTVGFLGNPPEERQQHPTGHRLTATEIYDCFHCHSAGARQSPSGVVLDGMEQGVRCESCHGPGAAHIQAARAGRPHEGIQSLLTLSARDSVAACAACHRSTTPRGLRPDDPVVVRFAPVGLQQSRCFRESGNRLSCVTCHNPHEDASRDTTTYNAVCGSCHGAQPAQKLCPVQPRGDCVSCHMPKQIIQRNSIFTDHWIRVVKRGAETGAVGTRAGR